MQAFDHEPVQGALQCRHSRHQEYQQDSDIWRVTPLTCQPHRGLVVLLAAKHACLAAVFLRQHLQACSPCLPGAVLLLHSAYCASLQASRLHLQWVHNTLLFPDRLHGVACKCSVALTAYVSETWSAGWGFLQNTLAC